MSELWTCHRLRSCALWIPACLGLLAVSVKAQQDIPRLNTKALQTLLGIPTSMATLKDGYVPLGQDRLRYVLIEDVHHHPEAQGKIAAMVLFAHHHWGSQNVFMEGAFGVVGPPPFPLFSVERGEMSVNELLRRGMCSGGELAAALASQSRERHVHPLEVVGMEDPSLYWKQLETFDQISRLQPAAQDQLNALAPRLSRDRWRHVERLIHLRLTPTEYREYERLPWSTRGAPELSRAISLGELFYRLTDERSRRFADRARYSGGKAPHLLVLGGFHVEYLTRILRQRRESYVVLTPHLTERFAADVYPQSLKRTLSSLHQWPSNSIYAHAATVLRLNLERQRDTLATH